MQALSDVGDEIRLRLGFAKRDSITMPFVTEEELT
jgi:hypothetical protein